jgi:hypothetical protein
MSVMISVTRSKDSNLPVVIEFQDRCDRSVSGWKVQSEMTQHLAPGEEQILIVDNNRAVIIKEISVT